MIHVSLHIIVHPRRIEITLSKTFIVVFLRSISQVRRELKLKLSKHGVGLFLYRGFTYYQVNTLDSRITNIDQLLTQDVEKFCVSVADLYTNISKVIEDDNRLTSLIVKSSFVL